MRCLVCNHQIDANGAECANCGFSDINKIFVNQQEGDLWRLNTVIPYRNGYIQKTVDLYAMKLNMQQLGTPESKSLFYSRLEELLDENATILCPVDAESNGVSPVLLTPISGAWFLTIYSGVQSTPCPNHPVIAGLKASFIIKYLWDSIPPLIDGLIIDPYDKPAYIVKDAMQNWKCMKDYQI